MKEGEVTKWANRPGKKRVLLSFAIPKTLKEAEMELGLKKLKTRPFVERGLLISLNPEATKGRLYVLSAMGRKLLGLPRQEKVLNNSDWGLIGWIMASPRQRLVVMKTIDSVKRTSEEIRQRASKLNPRMSRTSTKGILNELVSVELIETEMSKGKRYYWVSEKDGLFAYNLNSQ